MLFQYNIFVDLFLFLLNTTVLMFLFVDSAERKRLKRERLERLKKQKRKIEWIVYGIMIFSICGWEIGLYQGLFCESLIFLGMMVACVELCIILFNKIERKIESLKRPEEEREDSSTGITKRRFDLKLSVFLIFSF